MLGVEVYQVDLEYESGKYAFDLICKGETARQLRLRISLLENENDDLHYQLVQDDDRIDSLENGTQELQSKLENMVAELSSANSGMCVRNRELDNLKAEVKSLHGVSVDSTKLLTEKLALSRELAAIAPEVEHLRSQAASHQTLLAEKLLLQRQLSTAHVELETEKRAAQRALAKEVGRKAQDAQLESQLEELQAEIMKERRLRQKAERELQHTVAESESKQTTLKVKAERELQHVVQEAENTQTVLSSRLDAFRIKLRTVKEQLKDAQEELKNFKIREKSRLTAVVVGQESSAGVNSRKRSIARVDGDNIGTPDGLPHAKRVRQGSTLPGDKSTFSITPFLNRTASVAPESPTPVNDVRQPQKMVSDIVEETGDAVTMDTVPKRAQQAKLALSREKGETIKVPQQTKAKKTTVLMKKIKKPGRLEKVQEEAEDEPPSVPLARSINDRVALSEENEKSRQCDGVDDTIVMKKKRRILGTSKMGRTLRDGLEEGEEALSGQGPSALRKPIHLGPRKDFHTGKGEISVGGFGTISPLKKDKRIGKLRGS